MASTLGLGIPTLAIKARAASSSAATDFGRVPMRPTCAWAGRELPRLAAGRASVRPTRQGAIVLLMQRVGVVAGNE
jgi:hypothetical protein